MPTYRTNIPNKRISPSFGTIPQGKAPVRNLQNPRLLPGTATRGAPGASGAGGFAGQPMRPVVSGDAGRFGPMLNDNVMRPYQPGVLPRPDQGAFNQNFGGSTSPIHSYLASQGLVTNPMQPVGGGQSLGNLRDQYAGISRPGYLEGPTLPMGGQQYGAADPNQPGYLAGNAPPGGMAYPGPGGAPGGMANPGQLLPGTAPTQGTGQMSPIDQAGMYRLFLQMLMSQRAQQMPQGGGLMRPPGTY